MSSATVERPQPLSTPDKKPTWEQFDSIVLIKVGKGENQKVFEVYKGVLKFYSGYFQAAIDNMEKGNFQQAEENTIALPDEEVKTFEVFKSWLFTKDLKLAAAEELDHEALAKLWCFGDRRQSPLLQNHAINAIHRLLLQNYSFFPSHILRYVYSNTCEGAALRRFLIWTYARRVRVPEKAVVHPSQWSVEILTDLTRELFTRPAYINEQKFGDTDMCAFHVHEEGARCEKHT